MSYTEDYRAFRPQHLCSRFEWVAPSQEAYEQAMQEHVRVLAHYNEQLENSGPGESLPSYPSPPKPFPKAIAPTVAAPVKADPWNTARDVFLLERVQGELFTYRTTRADIQRYLTEGQLKAELERPAADLDDECALAAYPDDFWMILA